MAEYSILLERSVELRITFAKLAEAFDVEWLAAQKRGLSEGEFVQESADVTGWDMADDELFECITDEDAAYVRKLARPKDASSSAAVTGEDQ